MRVVQALKKLRDDLKKAGITEYKAEAVYALSAILGMSIS